MALRVTLDPSGIGLDCSYWTIGAFHLDFIQRQITLFMHGWADLPHRRAGKTAPAALLVVLEENDLPHADMHQATTQTLYLALKTKADLLAGSAGECA